MKILPLSESRLDDVVAFVVRLNREGAHHISDFGETEAEVNDDLKSILPPEGNGYLAIIDHGAIAGLLGVEIDLELGRCWLFGPLVDHEAWESVADALYDKIMTIIPPEINDQQLSYDAANKNVEKFAVRHGFTYFTEAVVLTLHKSSRHLIPAATNREFEEKFIKQFTALHANLFPNTYYSGQQLVEKAKYPDNQLFIRTREGNLAGYIFIQARKSSQAAYIDFLGVDERVRREGIGRHLLASGLNWAFSHPEVQKVDLTVRASDVPAIRLYESMGFSAGRTVKGYRKRN
jgi:ribosomal protein S18 acetylase RimI-like enzyme